MSETSSTKPLATAFALLVLALGILAFLPGITTHYGEMSFAGEDSGAELLGVFEVGILESLLLVALGIAGLVLARTLDRGRTFLLGGGSLVLLLGILGLAGLGGWLPVGTADGWLYVVLGLAMTGGGLLTARHGSATA